MCKVMRVPVSITDWQNVIHQGVKDKGFWDEGERNFGELLALIHSEVSEVLEEYRNGHGVHEIYYNKDEIHSSELGGMAKPEGIPIELVDILFRIFDLAGHYGINLEAAMEIKHEYNKTRPYRHGGKKI